MRLRNFSAQVREFRAAAHDVLGRSDPVVTRDSAPRRLESGELEIWAEDADERAAIDELLDTGAALLLQFPEAADEPDRYIEPLGTHTRERPVNRSWAHWRSESISWQAVEAPAGNIVEWPTGS